MTVLLVGYPEMGPDFDSIRRAVEDRGATTLVVDPRDWPGDVPVTHDLQEDAIVLGEEVDARDVTGAYVKVNTLFRPFLPRFAEEFEQHPRETAFVTREHRGLFEGLLGVLDEYGVRVCPPVDALYWHDRKPLQLHRLRANGVPVPDTLFTNDPEKVRAFFDRHDRVVHKAITQNATPRELTEDDLTDERLSALASAPVAFQEYVPGADLRTYVLDGDVVTTAHLPTDEMSFKESDEIESERVEVSGDVQEAAVEATEIAGLAFGAVDVVRREDGSFEVLEVNPAPGFGFLGEDLCNRIATALADYLVGDR